MGMFDKDKAFGLRLDREFKLGEHFVLYNAAATDEVISTDFGDAQVARLTVAKLDNPSHRYECQTVAGAIVEKCREAESSDFPAVVSLQKVTSQKWHREALVLQFVAPFGAKNEAPPPAPGANTDEDIPF